MTEGQRNAERARETTVRMLRSAGVREWHRRRETRERRQERLDALGRAPLEAAGPGDFSRLWIGVALLAIVLSLLLWWLLEAR